jgi:uncharacterized Tic20 family protein
MMFRYLVFIVIIAFLLACLFVYSVPIITWIRRKMATKYVNIDGKLNSKINKKNKK